MGSDSMHAPVRNAETKYQSDYTMSSAPVAGWLRSARAL